MANHTDKLFVLILIQKCALVWITVAVSAKKKIFASE